MLKTGSTLFSWKTSTFSPKAAEVKWTAPGCNTFVTSVTRTHSSDGVCWAECFTEERKWEPLCAHSCYFHLRGHMVDLADSQAPASVCLPQRWFGSVCIECVWGAEWVIRVEFTAPEKFWLPINEFLWLIVFNCSTTCDKAHLNSSVKLERGMKNITHLPVMLDQHI